LDPHFHDKPTSPRFSGELPLQEVSDFIDILLVKQDQTQWELWTHFREALHLAESDFSDYLRNLETYEEGLARGDIRW
jgi:hypothetical protein